MRLTVYVLTSDGYLDALPAFCHLFNKYWSPSQPVTICGFSAPKFELPENFTFFSIGKQEDYPIDKWTDALISTLHHFPANDVFLLMLEDYWLSRPVETREVLMLTDYMRQFRNCVKMDMRTDRRHSWNAIRDFDNNLCGHIPLVMSNPDDAYHMSILAGLWNRDAMLQILAPGETPWEVETIGKTYRNLMANRRTMIVLGTDAPDECSANWCPISHTLAHRRGDPGKYAFNEDTAFGLSKEDIDELLELNLIDRSKL